MLQCTCVYACDCECMLVFVCVTVRERVCDYVQEMVVGEDLSVPFGSVGVCIIERSDSRM
uniref:Uncharacterized protein n=1 Tax=Anguilla anguilla TaxID=7936 RepID=A0A0E9U4F3_ANGAN